MKMGTRGISVLLASGFFFLLFFFFFYFFFFFLFFLFFFFSPTYSPFSHSFPPFSPPGDNGVGCNKDCSSFEFDFPSSPYITMVGATYFDRSGEEHGATLSSGGFSEDYFRPSYQNSAVQGYFNRFFFFLLFLLSVSRISFFFFF